MNKNKLINLTNYLLLLAGFLVLLFACFLTGFLAIGLALIGFTGELAGLLIGLVAKLVAIGFAIVLIAGLLLIGTELGTLPMLELAIGFAIVLIAGLLTGTPQLLHLEQFLHSQECIIKIALITTIAHLEISAPRRLGKSARRRITKPIIVSVILQL